MVIVLPLLLIFSGYLLVKNKTETTNLASNTINSTQTTTPEIEDKKDGYTLDEIAPHSTKDDCWIAIEGKVYDVTEFIEKHPGGEAILFGCGKDASEIFNKRPSDGEPHSENARLQLPGYFRGDLIE